MPDFRVTIEIKDVARGDIRSFVNSVFDDHGADFDAGRGDFEIHVSERQGSNYFPIDVDSDED